MIDRAIQRMDGKQAHELIAAGYGKFAACGGVGGGGGAAAAPRPGCPRRSFNGSYSTGVGMHSHLLRMACLNTHFPKSLLSGRACAETAPLFASLAAARAANRSFLTLDDGVCAENSMNALHQQQCRRLQLLPRSPPGIV